MVNSDPGRVVHYQQMYDRMAPFYAGAMRLIPPWRRYTEQVLPWLYDLSPEATVVEIGPGPGVLLEKLTRLFPVTIGLDLSTGMLQRAAERLEDRGLPPRLVQGNATSLPLATESVDAVVATFTFSAIPDGERAMMEFARVLKPGGQVILVDAGEPADGNPMGVALARLWERFDDFMREEADLMRLVGLTVIERRDFGAFDSIRLVMGRKE
ncbi:MAG: class I SAM-dependent methyltransferase [Chloroflexota bacterium]|nr:class I SAM-dependent methyltransferase [Chloroflexota bacterium]